MIKMIKKQQQHKSGATIHILWIDFIKKREQVHLTQWNMHTEDTYTSLACTLHMFLHVPIPLLPPPQVRLPPSFREISVDYKHMIKSILPNLFLPLCQQLIYQWRWEGLHFHPVINPEPRCIFSQWFFLNSIVYFTWKTSTVPKCYTNHIFII